MDTTQDPLNCGGCADQDGQVCQGTQPGCCGSACTDLDNDLANCGQCANDCTGSATTPGCCAGGCHDLDSDVENCGACGNDCFAQGFDSCVGGQCQGSSQGCGDPNTQGMCNWPEYCGDTAQCVPAQNMDPSGADDPSADCFYTGPPTANADAQRSTNNSPGPVGQDGPILITVQQVDPAGDCSPYGLQGPDVSDSALCDGDGSVCGAMDQVAVFTGIVYDVNSAFATSEGTALDNQFYRVVQWSELGNVGNGFPMTHKYYGSIQDGHVVPQPDWTSAGGSFVLWRCFSSSQPYSTVTPNKYIPAHFAKTSGNPGNTYCASWPP